MRDERTGSTVITMYVLQKKMTTSINILPLPGNRPGRSTGGRTAGHNRILNFYVALATIRALTQW